MKIKRNKIKTNYNGKTCFTHARGVILENGFGLITTQPLRLSGCDVFYGMYISTTVDGGKTWSTLKPSATLVRKKVGNGVEIAMCDATPTYHKQSGKIILIGHYASYLNDQLLPSPRPRHTTYAVYDELSGDFLPFKLLEMPTDKEETYYDCGNGCGQSTELDDGSLLIPVYSNDCKTTIDSYKNCLSAFVLRCSFDGEKLELLEIGNKLTIDVPRGLYEPSIVYYNFEYFLALRNDRSGYVAKSHDGLNYGEPRELVFDNGENAGNYCTQQHWIVGGNKLYLVYTRKGADNDYVFRHRAPLFIAEFDSEKMCLIRSTEKIVIPNRGARLGNFGCQSFSNGKNAFVYASEWMQPIGCEKYGSDNSIFVCNITFE